MPAPRFVLDEFWPSDLFLGGIPGAWYDPTDLSTMFQDNTGLTPVTSVEQPVGLIFDKSQGTPTARYNLLTFSEQFQNAAWTKINANVSADSVTAPDGTTTADTITPTAVLGYHLIIQSVSVTNGASYTFSYYVRPNGYTKIALVEYQTTANFVTFDLTGAGSIITASGAVGTIASVGGGWYRVTHTSNAGSGTFRPDLWILPNSYVSGSFFFTWTADGTSGVYVWGGQMQLGSTATTYQRITSGTGGEWTPGNHASQSTAASRPTYRARYNLLTYSEDFGNAAWSTSAGVTFSGQVATFAAVTSYRYQQILTGIVTGRTYTLRVKLSSPTGKAKIALRIAGDATGTDQAILTVNLTPTPTVYTLSRTFTSGDTAIIAGLDNRAALGGDGIAGDVVATEWSVLSAADVNATGGAYQKVVSATVYDTAPIFRPYLSFDGLDDSLSTSAINFTATDKMTVFAGLSKLSDAALGNLAELGNRNLIQAGSFSMNAPRSAGNPNYAFIVEGTAVTDNTITGYPAPITNVMTGRADISAPLNQLRVNGSVAGTLTTTLGTGNFGTWPLYIGRRNNASLPFNGRIYELIVRGAASSVTEIADTELWVNARTGAF